MDWIKNQANKAAGGGKSSEKNEDTLDKSELYLPLALKVTQMKTYN
jgi:hypothetical protein